MNYDDVLIAFTRLMAGESNVFEHMETEGQAEAVRCVKMAKRMRPSREDWEQLGFVFTDIPGDNILCNAILPEGWSYTAANHPMWNDIFDENGMKRGSMFYKTSFYDRSAHMYLHQRYDVCMDVIDNDDGVSKIEMYFGNKDEKLFIAGYLDSTISNIPEVIDKKWKEEKRLRELAKQFGDENYPGWQSVHTYWENGKELSRGSIKTKGIK